MPVTWPMEAGCVTQARLSELYNAIDFRITLLGTTWDALTGKPDPEEPHGIWTDWGQYRTAVQALAPAFCSDPEDDTLPAYTWASLATVVFGVEDWPNADPPGCRTLAEVNGMQAALALLIYPRCIVGPPGHIVGAFGAKKLAYGGGATWASMLATEAYSGAWASTKIQYPHSAYYGNGPPYYALSRGGFANHTFTYLGPEPVWPESLTAGFMRGHVWFTRSDNVEFNPLVVSAVDEVWATFEDFWDIARTEVVTLDPPAPIPGEPPAEYHWADCDYYEPVTRAGRAWHLQMANDTDFIDEDNLSSSQLHSNENVLVLTEGIDWEPF